jgi:hypothetical protein
LGSTLLHINSDYCPHRKKGRQEQDRQQDTNTLKNNNKLNKNFKKQFQNRILSMTNYNPE